MPLLDGLEGYWEMDDASGNLTDRVNGNDAEPQSVAGGYEDPGKVGNAFFFNFGGGNDYFSIPNTADLLFGDESFSISAWAYLTDEGLGSASIINMWAGTTERSYVLLYSKTPNAFTFGVSPDGTNTNTTALQSSVAPVTLGDDEWYHVVAIHDADDDKLILYVTHDDDGTLGTPDETAHSTGCWDGNTIDIEISRLSTAGPGYWKGAIDEIGIWRKALSAAEVNELYNGGNGLAYSEFTSESGDDGSAGARYYFFENRR